MYTADEKKNAIQKYIDNNYNATKTVRELGYPSVPGLLNGIMHIIHQNLRKQ